MALEVRRIVTGHDSQGKAVVATDERLAGTSAAGRAGISRVEGWSTDKMPIDNSDAPAELQRKGFVVRHNYVGSGQGSVCPALPLLRHWSTSPEPAEEGGEKRLLRALSPRAERALACVRV